MGHKAGLAAAAYCGPLLGVAVSAGIVAFSVVQQKRSNPYLAGKHVIKQAELTGTTVTQDASDDVESKTVALTVTSSGETFNLTVKRDQASALVAAGKVYSREHEHEQDADGDGIDDSTLESGADKLEAAALLCLLGNYAVGAVCYLANKDKSDADRSAGMDTVFFILAVGFTGAPFALSLRYRKHEGAFVARTQDAGTGTEMVEA